MWRIRILWSAILVLAVARADAETWKPARQQGVASEEVASSMQQITDLIEQNTGAARAARGAADELLQTAQQLDQLISGFELYRR